MRPTPMERKQRFQTFVIFLIIFAAGFILRFQYVKDVTFPLNDGGLFYKMTQELIGNGFKLPEFTTYNQNLIPYAYPPLGFYFTGLLSTIFDISLLKIFLWFPFILNLIAIPVVYIVVKDLTGNRSIALFADTFWALTLPSYQWLIMGGGVTRSLAFTLSLLSLLFFTKYIRSNKYFILVLAAILGGMVGLSHLEIFWVNAISILIIWLFKRKGSLLKNLLNLLAYFVITFAVILPYLITVLNYHGILPFLAGFHSGEFSILPQLVKIILFNYTDEFSFTIIAVFALLGIFHQIKNHQYFFVVWFILILILDPRSVNRSIILPVCILAAITLNDILIPAMKKLAPTSNGSEVEDDQEKKRLFSIFRKIPFEKFFTVFVFSQAFILAFFSFYTAKSSMENISTAEMSGFDWVKENTAPSSTFLILSGSVDWQTDQLAEWFPAMTDRKSLITVQGTEWLPGDEYSRARKISSGIYQCTMNFNNCEESTIVEFSKEADFIWISKGSGSSNEMQLYQYILNCSNDSIDYQKIFENEQVVIYSKVG
jgi:hypothetical protein